jgi:hypothetical protein
VAHSIRKKFLGAPFFRVFCACAPQAGNGGSFFSSRHQRLPGAAPYVFEGAGFGFAPALFETRKSTGLQRS